MSQPIRKYLVVDAFVIGKASSHSPNGDMWKAVDILCKIVYTCHKIVLDPEKADEDNIIDEYRRQAVSQLTKWWLVTMQTRQNKIVFRDRASINISVLTDPDDQKYFQVAINSPHKIIISEDRHFTGIAKHAEVTSKGISIWDLDNSLSQL
ncbi:MAG: hypothetical protein KAR20_30120 [Candidatus Heimdallarchaeota archaeon]|nr:hypothetical protein [Candidatus Heimdallarchaeota archaeon]